MTIATETQDANLASFYVTAVEGKRVFRLAGPYDDHARALAAVNRVREIACDPLRNANHGRAHFMAYGTCKIEGEPLETALGEIE